jgi:heme/copper-type cytochrome/quinol oxidase subunit 3
MEHRAPSSAAVSPAQGQSHHHHHHHEGRGAWVLTVYGISGLALFGVLLYFFSTYVTN